jgi:DNA-binding NarL/FixJ family response regulator
VFTTSGGTATVQACYNCGANSVIQKPAGFHSLAGIIRSLLNYWMCTTSLPEIEMM